LFSIWVGTMSEKKFDNSNITMRRSQMEGRQSVVTIGRMNI